MKLDALTRKVLAAYVNHPKTDAQDLAAALEISHEVVQDRLRRLWSDGVLQGHNVQVDTTQLGYPYEAFILAVPSPQTTREDLVALAETPLVTRVFTLATRRSIAFTVLGTSPDDVCQRGEALAVAANLEDAASVMLVDTICDDPGAGICRMIGGDESLVLMAEK